MKQFKIVKRLTVRDTKGLDVYLSEISKYPVMSMVEEEDLTIKMKKGDLKAREELINRNLRFVVSIAKGYNCKGITLEDLINAGNLGLVKAVDRFDPTRGFRLISYAVWWIRQSIQEHIDTTSSMIRKPSNMIIMSNRVKNQKRKYVAETGNDIAEEDILEQLGYTESQSKSYAYVNVPVISGDAYMSEDSDASIFDSVSADENIAEELNEDDLRDDVCRVLDMKLSSREKDIVVSLYGIGCHPESLETIGLRLNLTRERTRQIAGKAITKLQTRECKQLLSQYL